MTQPIDEAHKDFGAELRERRERLEWSRAFVAKRAGLAHSFLTELEAGVKSPTLRTLHLLAWALGVTPSKLVRRGELRTERRAERRFHG